MRELGQRMADLLEPGDVLGLVGELGAGKTRLVQGILSGLGCSLPATSPTFNLVHEHTDGRLRAAHFDFYRLRHPEEVLQIGWDDYLAREFVLLVEWADKFGGALMPPDTVWLRLETCGEHLRRVTLVQPTSVPNKLRA